MEMCLLYVLETDVMTDLVLSQQNKGLHFLTNHSKVLVGFY